MGNIYLKLQASAMLAKERGITLEEAEIELEKMFEECRKPSEIQIEHECMTNKEKALITYDALQKRKNERERGKREASSFLADNAARATRKKYKQYYSHGAIK